MAGCDASRLVPLCAVGYRNWCIANPISHKAEDGLLTVLIGPVMCLDTVLNICHFVTVIRY